MLRVITSQRRLVLAVLCTAGMWLSGGCRSDEVQGPIRAPDATQIPTMSAAPTTGLIGEWKLDEAGGTTANDSKSGYDATVHGGAAFVAGKIGNGLNLNNGTAGTGGKYAQMPSNATLDNVNEGNYSISVWFNPTTVPSDATMENRFWAVVAKANPHLGIFYNSAGKFLARHYLAGWEGEQALSAAVYPVGAWYHLVGAVNKTAGTIKLYVNGELETTANFTADADAQDYGTTPFQIGKSGSVWAANGKVDQVRIYNRELSSADVADLFNETAGSPDGTLRAGLWGMSANELGTLPAAGNYYKTAMVVPDNVSGSSKNINTVLAKAEEHDITVLLRLSGAPGQYTDKSGDCLMYDPGKYQAQLDRFEGNDALAAALSSRRAVVMLIDEPWHPSYCESVSETAVNQMGNWVKTRWPGAITIVRAPADMMKFGWIDPRSTPYSRTFWSKIDYGWGNYNHVAAMDSTPREVYPAQKAGLAEVNLGMIPAINIWDGGTKACWTQPDGRYGRIYGSLEDADIRGDFVSCQAYPNPPNSVKWVASPALLEEALNAAMEDLDAPIFHGWTHVGPDDVDVSWGVMDKYENRSDYIAAFKYWNNHGATRTDGTGWRPAKP